MTAFSGSLQILGKTAAQWLAYATPPLVRQPCVETDTGQVKIGNGVSLWADLPYVGSVSTESRVISGGGVSVVSDDATVAAATYFIEGEGTFSSPETAFNNIALSSSGTQRFVAFYGNTSSTVDKVEGSESALAVMPSTPADSVLLGYILVTDAAVSSTPDLSGYLPRADKATSADAQARTNDSKYLTALSADGLFIPRVTSVASATTVTLNCSTTDQYEITALADNVTFAAPLNPINGLLKLYVYKDNGVSRTITRNAIFVDLVGIAPTSTTANKVGMELVRYSSARSRWEIITVITQP